MQLISRSLLGDEEPAGSWITEKCLRSFSQWNEGKLRSYLIEITANILQHKDKSGGYLIDKILDTAGQKGTGKWSVINAMELGMPLGLIATAVLNAACRLRKNCGSRLPGILPAGARRWYTTNRNGRRYLFGALCIKLVSYAQGFAVLQRASDSFGWNLDLASIARMWRGGCIIRSIFLNDIAASFGGMRNRSIFFLLLISAMR